MSQNDKKYGFTESAAKAPEAAAAPPPAAAAPPIQEPAASTAGEDWQLDLEKKREPADPRLAGLYVVKHGTLYFNTNKRAAAGRKVRLSANDARHFLHLDVPSEMRPAPLVERVGE